MSLLITDCPRCSAKRMTFDLRQDSLIEDEGWESFCVCRNCGRATIFTLWPSDEFHATYRNVHSLAGLDIQVNQYVTILGYVNIGDHSARLSPEHLPPDIKAAFEEGAKCLAVGCFNAAAAMFRLALDLATKEVAGKLTSDEQEALGKRNERLHWRLKWLFDDGKLPNRLRDLASVVKDDGNDGAHDGTIDKATAEDLIDFAEALLTEIYTMPGKIETAEARRKKRKAKPKFRL